MVWTGVRWVRGRRLVWPGRTRNSERPKSSRLIGSPFFNVNIILNLSRLLSPWPSRHNLKIRFAAQTQQNPRPRCRDRNSAMDSNTVVGVALVSAFVYLMLGVILHGFFGFPWVLRDKRWRPKRKTDGAICILYPTLYFFAHLVWPLTYICVVITAVVKVVTAAVKRFCCKPGYSCCGLSCAKKRIDDYSADLEAANTSDGVTSQPPSYNESMEMGPVGKTSNSSAGSQAASSG